MDTIEKVYCTGHDNNDALVAARQTQVWRELQVTIVNNLNELI